MHPINVVKGKLNLKNWREIQKSGGEISLNVF